MRTKSLLLLLLLSGHGAGSERGSPLIQTYDTQTMGAAHISTHLAQLPDGRLCAANMVGLLRFDGVRWLVVRHPRGLGGMEFLALGPDGRIHTSFNGDIGYFRDDAMGSPAWHSLAERVPEVQRSFGDVIGVSYDAGRRGVWFATYQQVLFVPDDGGPVSSFASADPEQQIAFGGLVGDEYWVQRLPDLAPSRVKTMGSIQLEPVVGGEAVRQRIRAITSGAGDRKIALSDGTLLSYHNQRLVPWVDHLVPLLAQSSLRDLIRLRDGRYGVGTASLGLLILDSAGALTDRYVDADGVATKRRTHALIEDREGDVWLAQDQSISRVALARAVTVYDETRGLPSAYEAARWQGQLYVASSVGLHRLIAEPGAGGGRFEQVLPQLVDVRSIAVVDEQTMLVIAADVHAVRRDERGVLTAHKIADFNPATVLEASRYVAGRVWVAHSAGLARIDRDAGGAFVVTAIPDLATAFYKIAERDAHSVWAADRLDGVTLVDADGAKPPRHYGAGQGLPTGQVRIYRGHGQPWFTTNLGLRIYDAASDGFVVPTGLPHGLHKDRLFSVLQDEHEHLWVRGGEIMNDVYWRTAEGWRPDSALLNAVDPHPTIFGFMSEGNIVWAIRANGLLRFDLSARIPLPPPAQPLLTQVYDLRAKAPIALDGLASLSSSQRDLRFEFAQPALHRPEAITFRSRLLGYEEEWSDWAGREASTRVYTNIPDGAFTFEVEAMDSFWRIAAMAPQPIAVAPPWWRSNAARFAYVLLASFLLWVAARMGARRRQRQLLVRQRELEATVEQRTLELQRSNEQLARQAERLTEADRLKTRFFINVGHEFRTPLTLVLGPIDDLLRDVGEHLSVRARQQLEMANRNARRVLELVVELLDVNRFEQGQMRLTRVRTDLSVLAARVLEDSQPLLERHGHQSNLRVEGRGPWLAIVDPIQVERCMGNLIGNAAKYMARGGMIGLQLRSLDAAIEIAVSDQGRGIAASALPHVFDRFFQSEDSDSASGYGIGLALVREIVEAQQGTVAVESEPGLGSTFYVRLPVAAAGEFASGPDSADLGVSGSDGDELAIEAEPRAPVRGRPLVLVIDDHDDLRMRARELLQGRFDVVEAADGPSAWNIARDRLPDVIVSDVMMPGFDGIELTRRLRADAETSAIAVLLLTAKVGSEHAVAGLRAGADDYLAKPFDASELLARIDALLARAQRLRLRLGRERAAPVAAPTSESADQRWRRRLDELIAERLDDPELSVEQLAQSMHADRSQLFRKCKELLAMGPSEYLRDQRLRHAHQLLEGGAGSISEVAYAAGFDSLSSFTRAFKARYGIPPSGVAAARKVS